jgi:hypothetical protein
MADTSLLSGFFSGRFRNMLTIFVTNGSGDAAWSEKVSTNFPAIMNHPFFSDKK